MRAEDRLGKVSGKTSSNLDIVQTFGVIMCRHDCQDGSDENDCNFSHLTVNKHFFCFRLVNV